MTAPAGEPDRSRFLLRAVASGLFAVAAAAGAQEPGAQETPTSQRRADAGPPPPVSLTTLTSGDVQAWGITSLPRVASATPALTLIPSLSSSNTPQIYLRGQGLDDPSQITRDGAVGVYQDGFYIARAQALTFDLAELERIEVLRGPQGALCGRDTTGGVVNLISRAPAGEFRFKQSADFGNRNLFRVLLSVDAPRWHGLSAKVTALASAVDGYVKNTAPGAHAYGEEVQQAGRLQLRWDALASVRADYSLEKSVLNSTAAYDTNPYLNGQFIYSPLVPYYANPSGPTTTTYRPVDLPLSRSNHVDQHLALAWEPGARLVVKSLTGYRTLHAQPLQDYAEFLGISEQTQDEYDHYQFSQELRFTGSMLDQELSYTGGAAYFKEHGWHTRDYDFPTLGRQIEHQVLAETKSEAAYIELHWHPAFLWERLELTLAGRSTRDVKDAERFVSDSAAGVLENGAASGAVNHLSYRRFNTSGTVSYRWAEAVSTYATVATGYRAGAALESAPVGEFGTNTFQPESLVTYELGLRSTFSHERLRANVAAFSSTYRDIQYPIPVSAVADQAYSLQKATIRGVDFGLATTSLGDLALSADVAFLHWTVDKVVVLPGTPLDPASGSGSPYSVGADVTDLFVLPNAPKYNFTAAGDYTFLRGYDGNVSAHVDYVYRGEFYSDPAAGPGVPGREFDTTPAVGLLNARIVWATEIDSSHHVKVGAWSSNVLKRRYYQLAGGYGSGVSAFQKSATGVSVPVGWVARAGAWAEPAGYGISVSYEY